MRLRNLFLFPILLFFLFTGTSVAGEHPEDHPAGEKSSVTTSTLSIAIQKHVEKKTNSKDGYFYIHDKDTGKDLALKLKSIHKDRLSAVREGIYFACVDFVSREGILYDIDFFMKDTGKGLQLMEMTVHKEAGVARYSWQKKGDFWIQKK